MFYPLAPLSYDVIVADPPWDYDFYNKQSGCHKGAAHHYETMSLTDIKAMPVSYLARGDCLLLLWATAPMLPNALDVMKVWGFTYKSEVVWRKLYPSGKPRMGTGYRVRSMHEPILLGTIGAPRHTPFPSLFNGIAREHSRKPEEFYHLVRAATPQALRRADLFARESRDGFDVWGNEATKFDDKPIEYAQAAE